MASRRKLQREPETRTYETRVPVSLDDDATLGAGAVLFGRMSRSLHARRRAGGETSKLKVAFQPQFGVTSRWFNSARIELDGKIKALRETRGRQIVELALRIACARKVLKKFSKARSLSWVHHKKRRLCDLEARLLKMKHEQESDTQALCFGGRKLFRAQYFLEENGFASHAAWKAEWRRVREQQFLVAGSWDETAGNQTCVATVSEDGTLTLRLRLPDGLGKGTYLYLHGLHFNRGHRVVREALRRHAPGAVDASGNAYAPEDLVPLSYRFIRDAKGWRVSVSLDVGFEAKPVRSRDGNGVISVDVNSDHLAVVETDRFGNPVASLRIACDTRGKTHDQTKAIVGDAVKQLLAWAVAKAKPIVLEDLDFSKKKAQAEAQGVQRNRGLSRFAYALIASVVHARAFDAGIEVLKVNPAWTSVIGENKFARRYGLSSHQAAALVIGRRSMGLGEALPKQLYNALPLPVRNRGGHVWRLWAVVAGQARAARAAQRRSALGKAPSRAGPDVGPDWLV